MRLLDIEHDWVPVNAVAGETQTADFLAMNANGKIPVLQIGESEFLTESNAVLNFLAEGTDYLPDSGLQRARVLEWQFFEQYSHEPYIAVARFINKFLGMPEDRRADYASKQKTGGHKALTVMENQLAGSNFLVGNSATIADISLYAYTHVADEGGFNLSGYPAVRDWISRIQALPNYAGMEGG